MRNLAFCICKNKDADQLPGNHTADQRLGFCYIDTLNPLLPKFEISSSVTSCTAQFVVKEDRFSHDHSWTFVNHLLLMDTKMLIS